MQLLARLHRDMARLLPYATQTPPRAGGRQMFGFLRLAAAFVVGALLASILKAAVNQHRCVQAVLLSDLCCHWARMR